MRQGVLLGTWRSKLRVRILREEPKNHQLTDPHHHFLSEASFVFAFAAVLPFASGVTQFQETRIAGGAVCDVIPSALLVRLVLSFYVARVPREVANRRIIRAALPVRIRIALQYRALNLAL